MDYQAEKVLKALGVKDSKELSPQRREELYKEIEKVAKDIFVLKVGACRIDTYRKMGINLDKIEAMKMAEIIDYNSGNKVIIDSLTHNPKNFKKLVESFVKNKGAELVVENYMDETMVSVSAASIVAKVERDKEIEELKKEVGVDFGVGYPHDSRTIEFLEQTIKNSKGKELPDYIRKTWVTTELLQDKSWQKKVMDFMFKKNDGIDGELEENEQ